MAYRLYPNFTNSRGAKIELGDPLTLQMTLTDALGGPIELRRTVADPPSSYDRDFSWKFYERIKGGQILEFRAVTILSVIVSQVELEVPAGALISRFGYRHILRIKWPLAPTTEWRSVASGNVITVAQLADRGVQLSG